MVCIVVCVRACLRAFVRAIARACVRAGVSACARVRASMRAYVLMCMHECVCPYATRATERMNEYSSFAHVRIRRGGGAVVRVAIELTAYRWFDINSMLFSL